MLDQSPVSEGSTGSDALHNSVDLARLTDDLGYHRYWVAEHHGTPMVASASPEVLISAIGAATSRLRIGSGGVMLPHYSPLKVAETFSMLTGLYPGRIDLGIGRAPGTDPETMFVLQRDRRQVAPNDFRDQLEELLGYIDSSFPPRHPLARLAALPGGPGVPEVWLLGSSSDSAMWAAEFGLPYSFADFINPRGAAIARIYRESYSASDRRRAPHVTVGVAVICADTDEEAERLSVSQQMAFMLLHVGRLIPVPPVDKALRFLESQPSPSLVRRDRRVVVGSPATVRVGLEEVAREYEADEVLIVTITHEHVARRRSYELIAEEFGLSGGASVAEVAPPVSSAT